MADWVKFHRELNRGAKRAMSRATRYVFMELSLEARAAGGRLELPPTGKLIDVIHDLIGGNRRELATALRQLLDENCQMLVETRSEGRRFLDIPSWDKWNAGVKSTERVRAHRAKMKRDETVSGVPLERVSETDCNALEERRGEENRSEERRGEQQAGPARALTQEYLQHLLDSDPAFRPLDRVAVSKRILANAIPAGRTIDHLEVAIADCADKSDGLGLNAPALQSKLIGFCKAPTRTPTAAQSAHGPSTAQQSASSRPLKTRHLSEDELVPMKRTPAL